MKSQIDESEIGDRSYRAADFVPPLTRFEHKLDMSIVGENHWPLLRRAFLPDVDSQRLAVEPHACSEIACADANGWQLFSHKSSPQISQPASDRSNLLGFPYIIR
jgi:hypothetical protein